MPQITRDHVVVPELRTIVFEAVQEVCVELKAKIEDVDEISFHVKGKSPKFLIMLSEKHERNTFIDIYDLKPTTKPRPDFIVPFFEFLVTKIPFDSAYETYSVDDVRTVRNDSRSDYIDPILLEPYLYNIEILDGTDEIEEANKLAIEPKMYNNVIELKHDKVTILSIPAVNIKKVQVLIN